MIDRSSQSVRSLSTQLSPPVLYQLGLGPALEWLAEEIQRNYGLLVTLHLADMAPLDETLGNTLFRIVRELLINIWKHAKVDSASVVVSVDPLSGQLELSVSDDGVGFDVTQALEPSAKNSYGLFSIRQRLGFIGGSMFIDSAPGAGTTVMLTLTP